jgi:hypothetical protein
LKTLMILKMTLKLVLELQENQDLFLINEI